MRRNKLFSLLIFLLCFCHVAAIAAAEYKSYGRRDPFVPLIGIPKEASGGGISGILTIDDVILQGIVVGPDGTRSAIINGEVVKERDRVGRLYVESIGDNTVKIKIDEESHEVQLYD